MTVREVVYLSKIRQSHKISVSYIEWHLC